MGPVASIALVVGGVLAGALLVSLGACSAGAPSAAPLFRDVPAPIGAPQARDVVAKRSRHVRVDLGGLRQPLTRLDLFPGGPPGPLTVVWDRTEQPSPDSRAWIGHARGEPESSVTLVVNEAERIVVGTIQLSRALYRIRYLGDGVHVIEEVDPGAFPKD